MQNNIIVAICNEALAESGQDTTISSLAENSNLAELCNRLWGSTVEEAYSDYPWAFKTVRANADLETIDTVNVYAYPDNCLRILGFYEDKDQLIPEKLARVGSDKNGVTKIYSPRAPLFIEYTMAASVNDMMPTYVRRGLVSLLASKIAKTKGKDGTKLLETYMAWLDRGQEANAREEAVDSVNDDRYINCR